MKTKLDWVLPSVVWLTLAAGCGEGSGSFVRPSEPVVTADAAPEADSEIVPVGPPMTGLHVVGNRIKNADGLDVVLHGVNRSGTEYQCAKNIGFFDGPADMASVAAMAAWKINAVRVPLNEACWLGINGVMADFAGENYQQAIVSYVQKLHAFNIVPVLDLHWVGPGSSPADRLQPLPDADHAPAFWRDVATTFKEDDGVILELYNEPFPERNTDTDVAWQCWRDGCECQQSVPQGTPATTYQAVGMQALVDAVRETGARHVLLLGGVEYSNALSTQDGNLAPPWVLPPQWLSYKPIDPLNNLGAVWHVYNFNACVTATCWDAAPAAVAEQVPLVSTELGENDCGGSFITSLMTWLDEHRSGYLAWTWDAYGQCVPASPYVPGQPYKPGQPYPLIADYAGTPNGPGPDGGADPSYGQTYHDHLANLAGP